MKEQFPAAPAWGQAGTRGRRDASVLASGEPDAQGNTAGRPDSRGASLTAEVDRRTRRPNPRYTGGEWAT
jgi:hypothetical protein